MNMKKRIIAFALLCAMVLCACGKDKDSSNDTVSLSQEEYDELMRRVSGNQDNSDVPTSPEEDDEFQEFLEDEELQNWIEEQKHVYDDDSEDVDNSDEKDEVVFEGPPNKGVQFFDVPEGTTVIGKDAFAYCTNLETVTIPSSVTKIEESAFEGCEKLSDISLPKGLREIGYGAFCNCDSLTRIEIPEDVEKIGAEAFSRSGLEEIILPSSITTIPQKCFSYCHQLNEIEIPNGVEIVMEEAFSHCDVLSVVSLPDSIKEIGLNAFALCSSLTGFHIPPNIEKIGAGAFTGDSKISEIVIPKSIKEIGYKAFTIEDHGAKLNCNIKVPQEFLDANGMYEDGFKEYYVYNYNPVDGVTVEAY